MIRAGVLVTFAIVASFLIGLAVCAPRVAVAQKQMHRAGELTLAGLRPGRDRYEVAVRRLGYPRDAKDMCSECGSTETHSWLQPCAGRELKVEFDDRHVVQTIDVELLPGTAGSCLTKPDEPNRWVTGHGIRLGDSKSRVISVYGKPGSVSPSTKDGRELELLYYAFDWAGPDVPQVMEITCERATGRVVEIMLAFPSL